MRKVQFYVIESGLKEGWFHTFAQKDVIYPPQTPVRRVNCAIVEGVDGQLYEVLLKDVKFLDV